MTRAKVLMALLILLAGAAPSGAVTSVPDQSAVVSGCFSAKDCRALVQAYMRALQAAGLSPKEIDSAATVLSASLAKAAGSASLAARKNIAAGLSAAAQSVSSASVRTQIEQVSVTLSVGIARGFGLARRSASGA